MFFSLLVFSDSLLSPSSRVSENEERGRSWKRRKIETRSSLVFQTKKFEGKKSVNSIFFLDEMVTKCSSFYLFYSFSLDEDGDDEDGDDERMMMRMLSSLFLGS